MFQKKPEARPPHTAESILRELEVAQASIAPLATRLASARTELQEAQQRYDAGVYASALGNRSIPDRSELAAAVAAADGLAKVESAASAIVLRLKAELAQAELAESVAASGERLPSLTAAAESAIAGLAEALNSARQKEAELFCVLFDEKDGLRQRFETGELHALANRARRALSARVMKLCSHSRFRYDPRFETDGERNFGIEDGIYPR